MIGKQIVYCGNTRILVCDANCQKAWGLNNRPRVKLSGNEDDYAMLADDELGEAPANPGTYEGGCGKPQNLAERLNRWCARECERSVLAAPGDDFALPDYRTRYYNIAPHHRRA